MSARAKKNAQHAFSGALAMKKLPPTLEQWANCDCLILCIKEVVEQGDVSTLCHYLGNGDLPGFIQMLHDSYGIDITLTDQFDVALQVDILMEKLQDMGIFSRKDKLGLTRMLVFLQHLWKSEEDHYDVVLKSLPRNLPSLMRTGFSLQPSPCIFQGGSLVASPTGPAGIRTCSPAVASGTQNASPLTFLVEDPPGTEGQPAEPAAATSEWQSNRVRAAMPALPTPSASFATRKPEYALPAASPAVLEDRSAAQEEEETSGTSSASSGSPGSPAKRPLRRSQQKGEGEKHESSTLVALSRLEETRDLMLPFRRSGAMPERAPRYGRKAAKGSIEDALEEAGKFMDETERIAKEVARTRLNAEGKNWQDVYDQRWTPQVPCAVCKVLINMKNWPGTAPDALVKHGWGCGTCAGVLQNRNVPPVVWCSSTCKKQGQKIHAWPPEGELTKKDKAKVEFCKKFAEARTREHAGRACSNRVCSKWVPEENAVGCSCGEAWYCSHPCLEQDAVIHMVRCGHAIAARRPEQVPDVGMLEDLPGEADAAAATSLVPEVVGSATPEAADEMGLEAKGDAKVEVQEDKDVEATESVEELGSTCVVCLEHEATHLGRRCGHLAWCRSCRRTAVHAVLNRNRFCKIKRSSITATQLKRTPVLCPVCREEACLVDKDGKASDLERVAEVYTCL